MNNIISGYTGIFNSLITTPSDAYGVSLYMMADEDLNELAVIILTPNCYTDAYRIISEINPLSVRFIIPKLVESNLEEFQNLVINTQALIPNTRWLYPIVTNLECTNTFKNFQIIGDFYQNPYNNELSIDYFISEIDDYYDIFIRDNQKSRYFSQVMTADIVDSLYKDISVDEIHIPFSNTITNVLDYNECIALNNNYKSKICAHSFDTKDDYYNAIVNDMVQPVFIFNDLELSTLLPRLYQKLQQSEMILEISKVNIASIVDNLSDGGSTKVLSAEQGKRLATGEGIQEEAIKAKHLSSNYYFYDPTEVIEGYCYRNDGTINTNMYIGTTSDYEIESGKVITIIIPILTVAALVSYIVFKNELHEILTSISYTGTSGNNASTITLSINVPEEAVYFCFPIELAHKDDYIMYYSDGLIDKRYLSTPVLNQLSSRWRNKKVNILGDSITYGYAWNDDSSAYETLDKPYYYYLKEKLDFGTVTSYSAIESAISTTSDYTDDSNAFLNRYTTMDDDADLIIIFGGTDDFEHNTPLGTIADTTDISFYGALHVLLLGLITKYIGKRIVYITPLHRNKNGTGGETNTNNNTLKEFVQAIKDVCEYYSIPVVDAYTISGINPTITDVYTTYMNDGLHPNAAGHLLLAKNIYKCLETV